jgi:hypothetical protein
MQFAFSQRAQIAVLAVVTALALTSQTLKVERRRHYMQTFLLVASQRPFLDASLKF